MRSEEGAIVGVEASRSVSRVRSSQPRGRMARTVSLREHIDSAACFRAVECRERVAVISLVGIGSCRSDVGRSGRERRDGRGRGAAKTGGVSTERTLLLAAAVDRSCPVLQRVSSVGESGRRSGHRRSAAARVGVVAL